MKIAKDTVVSLNYELFDSSGELLERVEEQISYLHGGYDGIFPLVGRGAARQKDRRKMQRHHATG